MNKIIRVALLCAVASLSTAVFAQQAPPAGAPPQGGQAGGGAPTSRIDDIDKAAGLTPAQRTKVEAILKQTDEAQTESREKTKGTWGPEAMAQMDAIFANEKKAILEVLDANQKPKYSAYFDAWKAERAKDKH
jgi:hypothetical protein